MNAHPNDATRMTSGSSLVPAVLAERHGGVEVLTLSNAPVNGLGLEMRRLLLDAIIHVQADVEVAAIVLRGANRMFCGGASAACFDSARDRIGLDDPNRKALLGCIRCVEASTQLVFEQGLDFERACFEELVTSEESVCARQAFFAQRAPADSPRTRPHRP